VPRAISPAFGGQRSGITTTLPVNIWSVCARDGVARGSRRVANGAQVKAVAGLAMMAPTSGDRCGYWQRAVKKAA